MNRKDFDRIHKLYVAKYPHLAGIKHGHWERQFAVAAHRLVPPEGVTPRDLLALNRLGNAGGYTNPEYREDVTG